MELPEEIRPFHRFENPSPSEHMNKSDKTSVTGVTGRLRKAIAAYGDFFSFVYICVMLSYSFI